MCSLVLTLSFWETASDDERIGTWASICFGESWADWSIEFNTFFFSFFLSAFYRQVSGRFIDSRFSVENSNGRQSIRDLCDGFEVLLKSLVAFLGNFEAKDFDDWLQRFHSMKKQSFQRAFDLKTLWLCDGYRNYFPHGLAIVPKRPESSIEWVQQWLH